MEELSDREKRFNALAEQALCYARNSLLVSMRFLETALCRFRFQPMEETSIATNGEYLFYQSRHVLEEFQENADHLIHDYLHMVLHCIFRHAFVWNMRIPLWDLACDIAVENLIDELGLENLDKGRAVAQQGVLHALRSQLNIMSAEKIYAHYQKLTDHECEVMRAMFAADDHSIWYVPAGGGYGGFGAAPGNADADPDQSMLEYPGSSREIIQMWTDISQQIQLDLETFSKEHGRNSGSLVRSLEAVNRERYDYTDFLRKFAVRREIMKLDHDEFDYIFYTYGLEMYRDMPLIEPLEYKEVRRIRDFIIAIDSSGSTYEGLLQKFVQKTYNILKSTESFFSKINVHIIQCDAEIQEAVRITSQEEFDAYLQTMKRRGGGGTNFIPVFNYADEMIAAGEFQNLKGIIYLTDGYGIYPKKQPDYLAAFVFIEEEPEIDDFPVWAISLVLEEEQL